MTRKDFELIANGIILCSEIIDEYAAEAVAEVFANLLETTNPNFDRARFLNACKEWN